MLRSNKTYKQPMFSWKVINRFWRKAIIVKILYFFQHFLNRMIPCCMSVLALDLETIFFFKNVLILICCPRNFFKEFEL